MGRRPVDARYIHRTLPLLLSAVSQKPRFAATYHAWRGEKEAGAYADIPGFCKAASLDEIRKHGHVLTPGRYVGAEAQEEDDEPFMEKMQRLATTLDQQFAESARLEKAILENLKALGIASQHV